MGKQEPSTERGEKQIWQRRFWEHLLRDDEEDWQRHMDYIHYNPVKHGMVMFGIQVIGHIARINAP